MYVNIERSIYTGRSYQKNRLRHLGGGGATSERAAVCRVRFGVYKTEHFFSRKI